MAFDLKAACDALATKYAAVSKPTGASVGMRGASGQIPMAVSAFPWTVIVPQDGEFIADAGAWHGTQHIDAVILWAKTPGDTARVELDRQLWLPTLLTATLGDMDLGQAGDVKSAIPSGWEFLEYPYLGTEYDATVIHFDVMVRSSQTFTP